MKVLMINGSPRKGNTYRLLERLGAELKPLGHDARILSLADFDIKACKGCYQCILAGEDHCPIKDDVKAIWSDILAADGIVLSSPVYALGVTGLMKNFIDRIVATAHRPRMRGKPAILLSTVAGVGASAAVDYLKWFSILGLDILGAKGYLAYPVGRNRPGYEKRISEDMALFASRLDRAMTRKKVKKPSLLEVIQFYGLKLNSEFGKAAYKADYDYYKGRDFHFKLKVNPLKAAIGKLFYRIGSAALDSRIDIGGTR